MKNVRRFDLGVITKNLSHYIEEHGFNLSKISRGAGVSYTALYSSLRDKKRERSLRDDELVAVCGFLEVNPMDFAEEPGKEVG